MRGVAGSLNRLTRSAEFGRNGVMETISSESLTNAYNSGFSGVLRS
jgi:hypothetical protein